MNGGDGRKSSGGLAENGSQRRGAVYRLGDFLFRYRSFTPLPVAIVLVWQARCTYPLLLWGLALMIAGESVRLGALRSSGKITRTRRVGARRLVTWGLYAHTRNPLYIGNLFLWAGAVLFAGGPWLGWLMAIMLGMFFIQYALIVALEETTLGNVFGAAYAGYCRAVPRVIPRLKKAPPAADFSPEPPAEGLHSWRYAFESERSTLWSVSAVLVLAILSTALKA